MGLADLMQKWFDRKPRLDPQRFRKAKPHQNGLAKTIEQEDGSLYVEIPLGVSGGRLAKMLANRGKIPNVKRYELEPVGAFVFEQCDGKTTCEEIARRLRQRYKMNRIEAEAALGAYLQTLSQRGLVSMVVPTQETAKK